MAISVLPLIARVALLVTAVGVIVCCLHIRRAHDAEPGRGAFALLGVATVAVVAVGALTDDLALTAIADLAVLLGVTGPTVLASSARG